MKIMHVVTSIEDEFVGPSYSVPSLCSALKNNECDVKDFDIIHSHMLWKAPNYYYGFIAKKPYLIAPRGTVSHLALNYSKWKKDIILTLWQKKALDTVTYFHATSEDEKDDIVNFGYFNTPCAIYFFLAIANVLIFSKQIKYKEKV